MRAKHLLTTTALALFLGAGQVNRARGAESASGLPDEQVLKAAKVGATGPELLSFFVKRTLGPTDSARIEPLVKQLGAASFRQRRKAKNELVQLGPPALSELRRVIATYDGLKRPLTDTELESRKNAGECLEIISNNPGPTLPLAALRLLEVKKPEGCCKALLGYLPFADNTEVKEEVIEALLFHGRPGGKVDPVLLVALDDKLPLRRAAAAYALGRMGDMSLRPRVRKLLADADPSVRQWAAYGLIGKEIYRTAEGLAKDDEKLFSNHKLPVDAAGLLAFFRKRTLSDADQERLKQLVSELGSKIFRKRAGASRALADAGSPALPFLRQGLTNPDVEITSRARKCITQIEKGPAKALASAGVRQIMRRAPSQALETLLGYVPFADDEEVEQEVLNAICALAARDVKVSPELSRNLEDAKPARRAAAAFVLGRVGTRDDCKPVRALLADAHPKVRLQAAQALLADRDKAAIPVLIDLLADVPFELALAADDLLGSATGAQPTKAELTADKVVRTKARDAWSAWWLANRASLDLKADVQDTPASRAEKARKASTQMLDAFLHLNLPAFKKSLKYPFFMEGMSAGGDGLIQNGAQIDQYFKMFEGTPQIKQELKQMAFKVTRVGRLDKYLAFAPPREKTFLNKLRKPEMYIVYIKMTHNGMAQPGGDGALFVRITGGRAWIVGMGNPRQQDVRKK